MDELGGSTHIILIFVVSLIGILGTVVYYFARYYFRTHDQDEELVKSKTRIDVSEDKLILKKEEELVPAGDIAEEKTTAPIAQPQKKTLEQALENTKTGFFGRIKSVLSGSSSIGDDEMESLEEILYTSDIGPQTVQRLMGATQEKLSSSEKKDLDSVREALKSEMQLIFSELPIETSKLSLENIKSNKPFVIMVVGVNGAGKTTTIGKLSNFFANNQLKTMIVAGDTFRAAAREQLAVWGKRAKVEVFNPGNVDDPSAVAFDACQSASAKEFDVVIIDTAGRLHTQDNLMEELKKMKRVIQKVLPEAPQETLIVLDANSGQNAMVQAKSFNESLELSGAILTKLDGTAKGGVALGLACELSLPIKLIGIGEGINDLSEFSPNEFINSII